MAVPAVVLTEYTAEDEATLRQWWQDEAIRKYLGPLATVLQDPLERTAMSGGRIARPTLRWMAHDQSTGVCVGYVSVQVTGQSGPDGKASPVGPPFHGGVNIVVDPRRQGSGFGTAVLRVLFEQPALSDVATLGGSVDVTNVGSLGMLRRLDLAGEDPEKRRDGTTFQPFTIPGPATGKNTHI
ncbi:GNAT family N-acetyltransferase (plasmid) [Nocardia sp. NBC_01377]|uniref:GNAT family N-acetyltransferase n=1 Tax=Nocardia sp. NBC_01377 TaxID=2903595 RepID=UPI002F909A6C